jgi:pilus assembly protein Flp/PilA
MEETNRDGVHHMSEVLAYLGEEDGASAAEYALILAIIGATIAASMLFLGNSISTAVNNAANCISTGKATNC